MSRDEAIENEIQAKGLTAPRITPADIEAAIVHEAYHVWPGTTLTSCVLTLRNGFLVTGESACASPENFDEELGRKIAWRNAAAKIWVLEGYLLRERLDVDRRVEDIARVCHMVNRAYCKALGDGSQPTWEDAPEWQRDSARAGARLHLEHPEAGPEASHESWMAQKAAEGWVYGPVKDPEAKVHPCMVPFAELPREQQAKDFIFTAICRELA